MYRKLINFWDACFESKVKELWETYHEDECSCVVVRHFPEEYVKQNLERLESAGNYYQIALRLGHDKSFDICLDRFEHDVYKYLEIMIRFNRVVSEKMAETILYGTIRDVAQIYPFTESCFVYHIGDDTSDYYENSYEVYEDHCNEFDYMEKLSIVDFKPVYDVIKKLNELGRKNTIDKLKRWNQEISEMIYNRIIADVDKLQKLSKCEFEIRIANVIRHTYWIHLTNEQIGIQPMLPCQYYYERCETYQEEINLMNEISQQSSFYDISGYRKWIDNPIYEQDMKNLLSFTNDEHGHNVNIIDKSKILYLIDKLGLGVDDASFYSPFDHDSPF